MSPPVFYPAQKKIDKIGRGARRPRFPRKRGEPHFTNEGGERHRCMFEFCQTVRVSFSCPFVSPGALLK